MSTRPLLWLFPCLLLRLTLPLARPPQDSTPNVRPTDSQLGIERFITGRQNQAKIRVYHTHAAYISNALGGTVLTTAPDRPLETGRPPNPIRPAPFFGAEAAALLPEGIEAVIAYERDNTIIAVFTDEEALTRLAQVVRAFDVPMTPVRVRARGTITVTNPSGMKKRIELSGVGVVSGERRIQLKTTTDGVDSVRGMPTGFTSDADIYARVLRGGLIDVSAEWYVDVAWNSGTDKKPIRLRNVFRASRVAQSGEKVTVTHSRLKTSAGMAELSLEITPWAIWPRLNTKQNPL